MIPADLSPAAIGVGFAGLCMALWKIGAAIAHAFVSAPVAVPLATAAVFPPAFPESTEPDSGGALGVTPSPRHADSAEPELPRLPAALVAEADRVCDFHAALARGARLNPLALDPLIQAKEPGEKRFLEWASMLGYREGIEVAA